jgi:D-citramalate synthase
VTERVIELGDKKESVTREDLPFIIADVLGDDRSGLQGFHP